MSNLGTVEVVEGRIGENGLGRAASGYLRSARHQPVDWMEWGEAAFERAAREDKAILLDIGAVWCHWCHVMDRESYEDVDTAAVINEHFVAVKVDRDERPDVDTRYQAAVAAISGQGGWPLTAFLTPGGKPFFGGTYFPPSDRHGRPSFRRVLLTMAEAFYNQRAEVEESAEGAMEAIEQNEAFSAGAADPGTELVEKLVASALGHFDPVNGGFGAQPKFPHAGAIDLLIDAAGQGNQRARAAVEMTLRKMARGGVYDQLAGGFHRYSVDERWGVPHFEKMAYDNSELLKNYVHAYQAFGGDEYAQVARDIMRWMDEWLTDRKEGGFYGSQDADVSLEDDGDYFTWTREEVRAALTEEEFASASAYFDLGEVGDMHHNPAKHVLRVTGPGERPAHVLKKMYAARNRRAAPYVDKTVYVGWNGMCCSAYLEAGRVLGERGAVEFALKTLDRVLEVAWDPALGLQRVVAYGESVAGARVSGVLEDYVFLGTAALDAWEAMGDMRYFEAAVGLMDWALGCFYDAAGGGFFDTEVTTRPALGTLGARRKPLQDSPTPAGNAVAASLLIRLEALTGREEYGTRAQETLESFAGIVEHFGLYAASYGLALRRMVEEPVQIYVIGGDGRAKELEAAALRGFAVEKRVVRLRREQLAALPAALAMTLPYVPEVAGGFAVVCRGSSCQAPATSVVLLAEQMARG